MTTDERYVHRCSNLIRGSKLFRAFAFIQLALLVYCFGLPVWAIIRDHRMLASDSDSSNNMLFGLFMGMFCAFGISFCVSMFRQLLGDRKTRLLLRYHDELAALKGEPGPIQ